MSTPYPTWLAVVALASAAIGCDESRPETAAADPAPSAPPPAPAATTAAPAASAEKDPAGDSRYTVAGWTVAIPNAWKRTTDKPTEQRFLDPEVVGSMPPTCSFEQHELPADQTDPLVLKEMDTPTVKDAESTATKVAGKSAMDHQFGVEPPGGSAPMRIWVRLVDIGGGKRLAVQCMADAEQFDALKKGVFAKIIESLEKSPG